MPYKEATGTFTPKTYMSGVQTLLPISGCPNQSTMSNPSKKANISGKLSVRFDIFAKNRFSTFQCLLLSSPGAVKCEIIGRLFPKHEISNRQGLRYRKHQSGLVTRQSTVRDSILFHHISSAARTATATCHVQLACRFLKCNRFGKVQRAEKKVAIVTPESRQGHSGIMEILQRQR